MRRIAIVGIGHTVFGNLSDFDLVDVLAFASGNALQDAGILEERGIVDQVIVANMGAGMLQHQSAIASTLVDRLSLLQALGRLSPPAA